MTAPPRSGRPPILRAGCLIGVWGAKIAYNHGVTSRNKHFDRVFHLIREQVTYQKLEVFWVSTKHQRADLLTKAVDAATFVVNRGFLLS